MEMNRVLSIALVTATLAGGSTLAFADDPAPGKQVEQSLKVSDTEEMPYLLYLPKDYKADGDTKYPVLLFLHGRGESYGPLSLVAKWGPPKLAAEGKELPYVVVSPQCPGEDFWSTEKQQARILALLKHTLESHTVDADRVYLTGLSMGGYGSWRLAADHPELFAAVAPICGGGKPEDAETLKALPIWAFHGDQDKAVPFKRSVDMYDAIKAAGGTKMRFTSLENIGHNCWSAAYATPELYSWMNRQKRSKE